MRALRGKSVRVQCSGSSPRETQRLARDFQSAAAPRQRVLTYFAALLLRDNKTLFSKIKMHGGKPRKMSERECKDFKAWIGV